jgi:hypothetical protein
MKNTPATGAKEDGSELSGFKEMANDGLDHTHTHENGSFITCR